MKHLRLRLPALAAAFAVAASSLSGCGAGQSPGSAASEIGESPLKVQTGEGGPFGSYREDDYNTDIPESATKITLSGGTASVEGSGAVVSGGLVTIQKAGDYVVTGELAEGQLVVDAGKSDQVHVILQNASIKNSSGAPFYAKQCGKLVLTLAGGSENFLADGERYTFAAGEDEPDAALFSKDDLTINGDGALTVTASYRNGIASKDDLAVISGVISVTAANDALRGRDSVSILGGDFTLTAGNDGIKSNQDADPEKGTVAIDGGTFVITAGSDGIQAETALTVGGGDFAITTGGGSVDTSTGGMGQPGGERPSRGGAGNPGRMALPIDGSTPEGMPELPEGISGGATPPGGSMPQEMPAFSEGALSGAAPPAPTAESGQPEAGDASADASAKGLKAGTALVVHSGSFALDCLDDALHTNGDLTVEGGSFTVATDDDGLHADGSTAVNGGVIEILRCYEGIEGSDVAINGGEIRLTARDDGVNAAGGSDEEPSADHFRRGGDCNITISGGLLVVNTAGDGLDANGSIVQTGGTVLVNGPTSGGNGALDYDGEYQISGGILAAAGSAQMAMGVSDSSGQPALLVKFEAAQEAGTAVNLTGAQGNPILSFAPSKPFEMIVLSAPGLALDESVTLSVNPDGNGGTDGLAESAESPGEALCTVTLSSPATAINSDGSAASTGGPGGMGGRGGGRGER